MQAWQSFQENMKAHLGDETIKKWLQPLKVVHFDACNLYLEAENSFQIDWFEEYIRPQARLHFLNNNSSPIKIHVSCAELQIPKGKKDKSTPVITPPIPFTLTRDPLFPEYTADSFIFNEANQILKQLLLKISSSKEILFNPIFLYGGLSSGKTHLLQAFASEFQKNNLKVLYIKAETFTTNVVRAIRSGSMQDFRNEHRHIDVLILDDVQHLAKKLATQEEFFHTFNALHSQGKQIILSANTAPFFLEHIEPRLVSRFEWGLSLPIAKLEEDDLLLLTQTRCKQLGLSISAPAIKFLLESFSSSVNSLQRSIEALCLRTTTTKLTITPQLIKTLLKDLLEQEEKKELTPERIVAAIADFYGLASKEILSKSQTQECTTPRQIAMFLCRNDLKMPFTKIGEYFERDHSTVISSVKLIEEKIKNGDKEAASNLITIKQKIEQILRK